MKEELLVASYGVNDPRIAHYLSLAYACNKHVVYRTASLQDRYFLISVYRFLIFYLTM